MTDLYGELAVCAEMHWGHERDWLALSKTDRAKLIAYYSVAEYVREMDREAAQREQNVRALT